MFQSSGRDLSSANRGSIAQLDGSGKCGKRSHLREETKGGRSGWESESKVGFLTLSILSCKTLTTTEVGESEDATVCALHALFHSQPYIRRLNT